MIYQVMQATTTEVRMVSFHMKPTKFDKEHMEALLDPGTLIILGNAGTVHTVLGLAAA